eukprot:scaffold1181_cov112-Isochrysis_galbana.AAC.3
MPPLRRLRGVRAQCLLLHGGVATRCDSADFPAPAAAAAAALFGRRAASRRDPILRLVQGGRTTSKPPTAVYRCIQSAYIPNSGSFAQSTR